MLPNERPRAPEGFNEPSEQSAWRWEFTDNAGGPVSGVPAEHLDRTFGSQADAESWVGEIWAELADAGVDNVTLFEFDRPVYGPMSLHA